MNGQNFFNFNFFLQVFLDFLVPLISCPPGHPRPGLRAETGLVLTAPFSIDRGPGGTVLFFC